MIKTFGDKETKELYTKGKSKKFPPEILNRALRKLEMIDMANSIDDLRVPPSNHLEKLKGDLKDFYSIRINNQYRIIFKFINGNAYDVKIVDYH
ncbi:MAG: type II toxin-antitoxin system RelE/ParE family toxin [Persephonella sp.]|nr:MAG: type II toxin-antitoxin system RelE/ParE family toxin [Persephonella sp.]